MRPFVILKCCPNKKCYNQPQNENWKLSRVLESPQNLSSSEKDALRHQWSMSDIDGFKRPLLCIFINGLIHFLPCLTENSIVCTPCHPPPPLLVIPPCLSGSYFCNCDQLPVKEGSGNVRGRDVSSRHHKRLQLSTIQYKLVRGGTLLP